MSAKALRIIVLMSLVLTAGYALAQEANPAKGVWVGHSGPTLTPQSRLVIVLDYDGREITGTLNPGTPGAAPLKVARMDITPGRLRAQGVEPIMPVFKLHLEADSKDAQGRTVAIVFDGTMNNVPLGNRTLTGTMTQTVGGQTTRADFEVQRQ
jgi:hypothetical protein